MKEVDLERTRSQVVTSGDDPNAQFVCQFFRGELD
jgi:hypothetical protein